MKEAARLTTDTARMSASTARRRSLRRWRPYLYLLPTFAFLIAFAYGPFLKVVFDSFYQWDGAFIRRFVGLANFQRVLFEDPRFWPSMLVAFQLTATSLVKTLVFPLIAAEAIHLLRGLRMAYWYRVLLVLPTVVPGLVGIFIWRLFYHPDPAIGLFNRVLYMWGGQGATLNWLGDPDIALWSLILMGFPWAGGFAMLIYLAGLQNIPAELYDASMIDGASVARRIWSIDLPLILGQVKVLATLTIIGGLQDFTAPFVLTKGGPLNATLVPGLHLYNQAFGNNRYGYASAMALVLFILIMLLSVATTRLVNSKVEY
jgi:ABC-type sugar transport system permease subunit